MLKRLIAYWFYKSTRNSAALAVCIMLGSTAHSAEKSEMSWRKAIANVERLRAEVESRLIEWENPGTSLNEIDVPAHRCSILGRMLGKASLIKSIEVDYSEIGSSNYNISIALTSLDNWLINAKALLASTPEERVRIWNLDCVGQLGIPAAAYIAETGSSTFYTVENDGRVLRVLGDVEASFADKISEAIARNPSVTTIALGSAGGYVREAMQAGLFIRRKQLNTVVWNDCVSACTLVFIAGVERKIWSPYPRLGFHRVSRNGLALDLSDPIYELIADYVRYMGVSPDFVLTGMSQALPAEMYYPSGEFLCDGAIITWMQRSYTDCG